MKKGDVLFQEALIRFGPEEMRGIERLIDEGHYGIAERHTVSKMVSYVRELEKRVGLAVPSTKKKDLTVNDSMIKINLNGNSYFSPRGE